MTRGKLTPYQRIVRAAKKGVGVRLTADECFDMGEMDDAIMSRALLDDDRQQEQEDRAVASPIKS